MAKVIGIDLGTTFSAAAIMEDGKPNIIPNAEGNRITPSIVAFNENNERLVGLLAKRQAVINPENTVRSIKRQMGRNFTVKIKDKSYKPEEISAFILQKIKTDCEAYLGEKIDKAVITVPAYFSDSQRQATKDAGRIAGLEVLRIVNEPTAASLAYGLDKDLSNDQVVLIYDLGGGTFDVSILELSEGVFEVKATSGNNLLGGDDFDQRIMDWLADKFKSQYGTDITNDKMAMQRLRDAAEEAKIQLSSLQTTNINLPYITADASGPKHLTANLSRSEFERMIADLIEKTIGPTRQALADADFDPKDIDRVILVGGSTRVPAVQNAIQNLIGKEPYKGINPDEVVALGAAVQAGVLTGDVEDVLLLDVTPLTLAIETLGQIATPLIERNTTIPTRKSQIFSTAADNQPAVEINVTQGERKMAPDNMTLGRFQLTGIPPAPRGVPQIEVTFDIDANGIVQVTAKDLGTGKEQKITISGTGTLSEADIDRMVNEAEKFAEEDEKKKKEIELINRGDSMVYQLEKLLEEQGDKIDPAQKAELEKTIEKVKKAVEEKNIGVLESSLAELEKMAQQAGAAMYQQADPQAGPAGPGGPAPGEPASGPSTPPDDDDVVDVEYEVEDDS
ncbi:MAG: molecular chaperone DnaK [Candidatus Hodarchaeales archaeon]